VTVAPADALAPMDVAPTDMTLDELRALVARALPGEAAFDGWTARAVEAAATRLGVPMERLPLLFPDGDSEMIDWWIRTADADMAAALARQDIMALKIRDRIRTAVWTRLDQAAPHREAVRRALAILARPGNARLAARTLWRTADSMWRACGDSAMDLSHYTKRMTLGAVYSTTLLVWLDDGSEGFADTAAFLDRRIDNVLRFEQLKARLRPPSGQSLNPARFLGRLRYPAT
jgi:ubiquinone biosynthesis protein COQ9